MKRNIYLILVMAFVLKGSEPDAMEIDFNQSGALINRNSLNSNIGHGKPEIDQPSFKRKKLTNETYQELSKCEIESCELCDYEDILDEIYGKNRITKVLHKLIINCENPSDHKINGKSLLIVLIEAFLKKDNHNKKHLDVILTELIYRKSDSFNESDRNIINKIKSIGLRNITLSPSDNIKIANQNNISNQSYESSSAQSMEIDYVPPKLDRDMLASAIYNGSLKDIENLLKNGVNACRAFLDLTRAIYHNKGVFADTVDDWNNRFDLNFKLAEDIGKLFIMYGVDINQFGFDGNHTALYDAILQKNYRAVFLLIKLGADVNISTHPGRIQNLVCFLISDFSSLSQELFNLLMNSGLDIVSSYENKTFFDQLKTPKILKYVRGFLNFMEDELKDSPAEVVKGAENALLIAAYLNDVDLVTRLLHYGVVCNSEKYYTFFDNLIEDRPEIQLLVRQYNLTTNTIPSSANASSSSSSGSYSHEYKNKTKWQKDYNDYFVRKQMKHEYNVPVSLPKVSSLQKAIENGDLEEIENY
ncbi:MAG: hypothetical protein P4L22_06155 [Candidatus Babeliales bacterium]|nr:hypothetical protein [Candidatus Babeliales bacterium]